ncbi:MAG: DUF924 domain-containing protein [Alphaproteobacteria bacterium]|nr:DUF924 domain-containing protein [Alphaproteobacteria bacterium]
MTAITSILDFWIDDVGPRGWYEKNPDVDREIGRRFGSVYWQAAAGIFDGWRRDARSCLALVIVLDQFPRNMFRGSCRSYATDAKARSLTRHALSQNYDAAVPEILRPFFYMPLQHSEVLADQELCVAIAERRKPGSDFHDYAVQHLEVVRRYGRFPHRNEVLGRRSTVEEEAFLGKPGSSF